MKRNKFKENESLGHLKKKIISQHLILLSSHKINIVSFNSKISSSLTLEMSMTDSERGSFTIEKISDLDKERLFRVALNEENEVNSLLAYYRDRINEFDRHREEWLEKYNKVRTPQDEAHKQAWELQKRKDEIAELKAILDEEKLKLYNERQEIIDIIKENDGLKVKEVEDRKKINELGLLGDQVEQEIVFYKDVKPGRKFTMLLSLTFKETINRYMKNDLSIRTNNANYEAMLKK